MTNKIIDIKVWRTVGRQRDVHFLPVFTHNDFNYVKSIHLLHVRWSESQYKTSVQAFLNSFTIESTRQQLKEQLEPIDYTGILVFKRIGILNQTTKKICFFDFVKSTYQSVGDKYQLSYVVPNIASNEDLIDVSNIFKLKLNIFIKKV